MALLARILLFIQIVVIAAIVGAFCAFFGLIAISLLLGADDREGALAMGAAGFMPIGAIAGTILGAWLAWRLVRRLERKAALAGGFGIAAFVAFIGAGWFAIDRYSGGSPYDADSEPMVLVEWRLPDLVPEEQVKPVYRYTMRSTFMDWTLNSAWDIPPAREEDGRTVLRFRGKIRWRRDGRIFQLWKFPNHDDRITARLNLGSDPDHSEEYGPWREVEGASGHAVRTKVVLE